MFWYYVRLSLLSYKRNPVLSTLMVLAIAVGVGAYMVIYTLNYYMGGNPIPHKSNQLYHVQLDYGDPALANFDPPPQLTYIDAIALLEATTEFPRSASSRFSAVVEPEGTQLKPFSVTGRGNSADFFAMFDVPFLYGRGWDRQADSSNQQVAVLSYELNERLYGGADSTGQTILLDGLSFTIIGVLKRWQPMPKFYDINNGAFDPSEDVYIPWSLIVSQEMRRDGNTNCWKAFDTGSFQAFLNAECAWIQFWVELDTEEKYSRYLDFINNYTAEQKQLGRMQMPVEKRLYNVSDWLLHHEVQPPETQILGALAAMLLAVCLLNTVGLLLSKFLGKSAEIGVRLALGANRGSLFVQHMIEAGVIGAIGGVLGLGVAALGLQAIRSMLADLFTTDWIQLNLSLMAFTIVLAIVSTIIAGLYPIWRACKVNPAIHLRTQ